MVSLLRLAYCFLGIDRALQLSSVLFFFWEQEVAGSNPVAPIANPRAYGRAIKCAQKQSLKRSQSRKGHAKNSVWHTLIQYLANAQKRDESINHLDQASRRPVFCLVD